MLTFVTANCKITIGSHTGPEQGAGKRPRKAVDIEVS